MRNALRSTLVTRRGTRRVTSGCLILLIIPACLLLYFWYSVWHTGHVNEHRRRKALSDLVQQVHTEADRTRASLNSSHANDAKAVDVIWQNTRAPLITRAASQDGFTTFIQRSAIYDEIAAWFSVEGRSRSIDASL